MRPHLLMAISGTRITSPFKLATAKSRLRSQTLDARQNGELPEAVVLLIDGDNQVADVVVYPGQNSGQSAVGGVGLKVSSPVPLSGCLDCEGSDSMKQTTVTDTAVARLLGRFRVVVS
ncbi:MAG TPA: hypothetical protein VFR82_07285 [Nitrospira sp.]|nr:hypothetical protein [Nitrospira sp.]